MLWIIDVYGFKVAGFLATMGTISDRIGRPMSLDPIARDGGVPAPRPT